MRVTTVWLVCEPGAGLGADSEHANTSAGARPRTRGGAAGAGAGSRVESSRGCLTFTKTLLAKNSANSSYANPLL